MATMNYLRTLALHMEAMEVQTLTLTSAEQEMALGKIITWTYEPKSVEVRKAAMASVVALFRLNANHFSAVLHKLPKVYQDNAADLVAEYVMSASSATLTDSMTRSSDLTSAMKPINAPEGNNGISSKRRDSSQIDNNNLKDPVDDSENMNPEEVHKSLRSTANAIQNYSFEANNSKHVTTSSSVTASEDLSSLADKMTGLDIGTTGGGPHKKDSSDRLVTKINLQNASSKGNKYFFFPQ